MSPQAIAARDAAVADVDREERRDDEEVGNIPGYGLATAFWMSSIMLSLVIWVLRAYI